MTDLLVGNTLSTRTGTCTGSTYAYYVQKTAIESGEVTELRIDCSYAAPFTCKFAVYDSSGNRLWWGSAYIDNGDKADDYQVAVSPSFNVTQGQDYIIYVATSDSGVHSSTIGTDYDVQYTSDLTYSDTPPSDIFSGISWSDNSRFDFAVRVKGTISSDNPFTAAGELTVPTGSATFEQTNPAEAAGELPSLSGDATFSQENPVLAAGELPVPTGSAEFNNSNPVSVAAVLPLPEGDATFGQVNTFDAAADLPVPNGSAGFENSPNEFTAAADLPVLLASSSFTLVELKPFRGTLNRAMIFDRALTAEEMKALFYRARIG